MRHIVYVLVSHVADPFKYLYVADFTHGDKLNTEVCYVVVYRIPSASVQTVTHACMPFYEYCLDQQATSLLPMSQRFLQKRIQTGCLMIFISL